MPIPMITSSLVILLRSSVLGVPQKNNTLVKWSMSVAFHKHVAQRNGAHLIAVLVEGFSESVRV